MATNFPCEEEAFAGAEAADNVRVEYFAAVCFGGDAGGEDDGGTEDVAVFFDGSRWDRRERTAARERCRSVMINASRNAAFQNAGSGQMMIVAPWAHDHDGNSIDPINLVMDSASATDVNAALDAVPGWNPPQVADRLYVHVGDKELPDQAQLVHGLLSISNAFRRIARLRPPHLLSRYRVHVRFWDLPLDAALWRLNSNPAHFSVVASSHVEPALWFHNPESFEWGEKIVARELRRVGWQVQFDEVPLNNALQSPPNNGFATRVWR